MIKTRFHDHTSRVQFDMEHTTLDQALADLGKLGWTPGQAAAPAPAMTATEALDAVQRMTASSGVYIADTAGSQAVMKDNVSTSSAVTPEKQDAARQQVLDKAKPETPAAEVPDRKVVSQATVALASSGAPGKAKALEILASIGAKGAKDVPDEKLAEFYAAIQAATKELADANGVA